MTAPVATERPEVGQRLNSNNPYRTQDEIAKEASGLEVDTSKEQQLSLDSEKQVVTNEGRSRTSELPMVVEKELSPRSNPEPEREAGNEVIGSWQTNAQEESAPIPVEQERSQASHGELLNDITGEPPSYDSLNSRSRSEDHGFVSTPTTIQPDNSGANGPSRPEDRSAVGQLLSWMPPPPSKLSTYMPPLLQPVIIPQFDVPPQGESVPFQRCYSDALSLHGIPIREFMSFLDGLAVAQAPTSALQGLKIFGAGVASIPLPLIPLAGKGISALATSGSGHSGSRARLYLERVKNDYFAPRGLRLSIVKDVDLSPRLQIPAHAYRLAPLTNGTLTDNLSKRRLEGLASYVAPLRFDVPEQDKQTQGVHRLARKHLESRFKDQSRRLTRMREEQWRNIARTSLANQDWDGRYKAKMVKLRQLQIDIIREQRSGQGHSNTLREMMQALDQLQQDLQLLASERQIAMQKAMDARPGIDAEMQEIEWSKRLKWIVIENLQ